FVSTDVERVLHDRGITRLYITGLHTDCCARHTSGDAFQKGFQLVWVTDVLQAFTDDAHRGGLEYFKTWYATDPAAQFKTTDELVSEGRPLRAERIPIAPTKNAGGATHYGFCGN